MKLARPEWGVSEPGNPRIMLSIFLPKHLQEFRGQLFDLVVDRYVVEVRRCGAGPGFEEVALSKRHVLLLSGAGAVLRPQGPSRGETLSQRLLEEAPVGTAHVDVAR